jgi:hypothetical protein
VFPKERRYPIHDLAHGKNALARVSAHGTATEQAKVTKAVYAKYPELAKRKLARMGVDKKPERLAAHTEPEGEALQE